VTQVTCNFITYNTALPTTGDKWYNIIQIQIGKQTDKEIPKNKQTQIYCAKTKRQIYLVDVRSNKLLISLRGGKDQSDFLFFCKKSSFFRVKIAYANFEWRQTKVNL
jgi:hypothetical protein